MTFGETSWLLLAAILGGVAAYAIPLGMILIERLIRHRAAAVSSTTALNVTQIGQARGPLSEAQKNAV
jgi:hypothetical protein